MASETVDPINWSHPPPYTGQYSLSSTYCTVQCGLQITRLTALTEMRTCDLRNARPTHCLCGHSGYTDRVPALLDYTASYNSSTASTNNEHVPLINSTASTDSVHVRFDNSTASNDNVIAPLVNITVPTDKVHVPLDNTATTTYYTFDIVDASASTSLHNSDHIQIPINICRIAESFNLLDGSFTQGPVMGGTSMPTSGEGACDQIYCAAHATWHHSPPHTHEQQLLLSSLKLFYQKAHHCRDPPAGTLSCSTLLLSCHC